MRKTKLDYDKHFHPNTTKVKRVNSVVVVFQQMQKRIQVTAEVNKITTPRNNLCKKVLSDIK